MRGGKPFAFEEGGAVSSLTQEQIQEMFGDAQEALGGEAFSIPANGEIRRPAGLNKQNTPDK